MSTTNDPTTNETTLSRDEPRSQTFEDLDGHEWTVALNFITLREIKKLGVDLGVVEKLGPVWAKILSEDELALRVIWQAVEKSDETSEDDWLGRMDGETLEAARDALLGAIENFSPAKRVMIAASAAKVHEKYREAIAEAATRISSLTDETIQRAMKKLRQRPPGRKQSK